MVNLLSFESKKLMLPWGMLGTDEKQGFFNHCAVACINPVIMLAMTGRHANW